MGVSDWAGASLPWSEDLTALKERVAGLFRRAEPRRRPAHGAARGAPFRLGQPKYTKKAFMQ